MESFDERRYPLRIYHTGAFAAWRSCCACSIDETAHGGAAYLLGDRTARDSGRVTLSPMAHIDPIGFLCLLLFGFGWARPVPVNIANFRNRRWGMALTALAGPVSNFITAFIAYCL